MLGFYFMRSYESQVEELKEAIGHVKNEKNDADSHVPELEAKIEKLVVSILIDIFIEDKLFETIRG